MNKLIISILIGILLLPIAIAEDPYMCLTKGLFESMFGGANISGDFNVSGDLGITGTITANSYLGDGSALTGVLTDAWAIPRFVNVTWTNVTYDAEWNTQAEVEVIWGVTLVTDADLLTNLTTIRAEIVANMTEVATNLSTLTAGKEGDNVFLYNDSTTMYLNETKLNATIDDRDSDTVYDDTDVRSSIVVNMTQVATNLTLYSTAVELATNISTVNTGIGDNITSHEDTYKHGNTTAEIQAIKSDNATYADGVTCSDVEGATSDLCTIEPGATQAWAILRFVNVTWTNYTLDAEWNTQGEVEVIWGVTLATDADLLTNLTIVRADIATNLTSYLLITSTNWTETVGNLSSIGNWTADKGSYALHTNIQENMTQVAQNLSTLTAGKEGDNIFLYNDSTIMYLNETKLNATIDDRDSDTIYDDTNVRASVEANATALRLDITNNMTQVATNLTSYVSQSWVIPRFVNVTWTNYTLDSEWNTQTEVEAIWGVTLVTDADLLTNITTVTNGINNNVTAIYASIGTNITTVTNGINNNATALRLDIINNMTQVATNISALSFATDINLQENMTQVATNLTNYILNVSDIDVGSNDITTTGTGTFGTLNATGEILLKDLDGEYHNLSRDLQTLDEISRNITLTGLNGTLDIATGNVTVTTLTGDNIVVNIDTTETILNKNSDSIIITSGTNESPTLNQLVYVNAANPVLTKRTTLGLKAPSVAAFLQGANFTYASAIGLATIDNLVGGLFNRFFRDGSTYRSGFDINVSTNMVNISTGVISFLFDEVDIIQNHSTSDLYVHVHSNGSFHQHLTLDTCADYNDGSSISNNKYFIMVVGIAITHDGKGVMYATTNDRPSTEYTKAIDAEVDIEDTINFFPPDEIVSLAYIPIARVVIKRSGGVNTIQTLSNGMLYDDLRGTVTKTSSSPPPSGITAHSDLTNLDFASALHTGFTSTGQLADNMTQVATNLTSYILNLSVTNLGTYNFSAGNITALGKIIANSFEGDGSALTGLSGAANCSATDSCTNITYDVEFATNISSLRNDINNNATAVRADIVANMTQVATNLTLYSTAAELSTNVTTLTNAINNNATAIRLDITNNMTQVATNLTSYSTAAELATNISTVNTGIGDNITSHEDTYKHGNTTAEIQAIKSDNATYADGVTCSDVEGATSDLCTIEPGATQAWAIPRFVNVTWTNVTYDAEWNTLGEVEVIWGVTMVTDADLLTNLTTVRADIATNITTIRSEVATNISSVRSEIASNMTQVATNLTLYSTAADTATNISTINTGIADNMTQVATNLTNYVLNVSNIDIGAYNITTTGWIQTGTLNVTGTSYLGNLIITAENITVDNLLPLTGGTIKIWGDIVDHYNESEVETHISNNISAVRTDIDNNATAIRTDIVANMTQVATNLTSYSTAAELATNISTVITGIEENMTQVATNLTSYVSQSWVIPRFVNVTWTNVTYDAEWNTLGEVEVIWGVTMVTDADLLTNLTTVRADIATNVTTIRADIAENMTTIATNLTNYCLLTELVTNITSLRTGIEENMTQVATNLTDYCLLTELSTNISSVITGIEENMTQVATNFTNYCLLTELLTNVTSLTNGINNNATAVRTDITNNVTSIYANIGTNVTTLTNAINNNATAVRLDITNNVTYITTNYCLLTELYTNVTTLTNGINNNATAIRLDITNNMTQVATNLTNYVLNVSHIDVGPSNITAGNITITKNLTITSATIWYNGSGICIGAC